MMSLEEIKLQIEMNRSFWLKLDNQYDGLTSAEIGCYNRTMMFGENDELFPDQDEWFFIVG